MEWIRDYWYIIVLGLVAAMFLFGFRAKDKTGTNIHDEHPHGKHTGENTHSSSHGCCH